MSLAETLIGWLAPARCLGCDYEGQALCEACATSEILGHGERCWRCGALTNRCRTCPRCRSFGGPRYAWITTDYVGLASCLIRAYKFGHRRYIANPLAGLMAETFLFYNDGKEAYLVVPVPTATGRVRQRGFDHSTLLARTVARKLGLEYQAVLGRLGQASQIGARRSQRLKQPLDNYFVRLPALVAGRNVLLIDDVITTGGTLRAATKTLRTAGARHVDALVFAKRL